MIHEWRPDDDLGADVPIGRPAPGVTLRVLDAVRPSRAHRRRRGAPHRPRPGWPSGYLDRDRRRALRRARTGAVVAGTAPATSSGVDDRIARLPAAGSDDQLKVGGIRLEPARGRSRARSHPGDRAEPRVRSWSQPRDRRPAQPALRALRTRRRTCRASRSTTTACAIAATATNAIAPAGRRLVPRPRPTCARLATAPAPTHAATTTACTAERRQGLDLRAVPARRDGVRRLRAHARQRLHLRGGEGERPPQRRRPRHRPRVRHDRGDGEHLPRQRSSGTATSATAASRRSTRSAYAPRGRTRRRRSSSPGCPRASCSRPD